MINQPQSSADPSRYYKPMSQETLTVDNTARTPTVPVGTRMAKVFFRGGTVRLRLDNTNPTSSSGVPVYDGYEEFFSATELAKLRLIREGAADGEVHFIYYQ